MFKDTVRKLPPVNFGPAEPARLDELVSDAKVSLHSSEPLRIGSAPGCDPYDSRMGQTPEENWRRRLNRP